jgi:hypothetical protein
VENGKACYTGSPHKTIARISCIESYTFDEFAAFMCMPPGKTWSPATKAVCSLIGIL